jgi:hypothetical protein
MAELHHAKDALQREARNRLFLEVRPERKGFVDSWALFGQPVHDAFPSARFDIRETGNCLAAECHTAAVFHMMRAAEWGIRALCVHLGLKKLKWVKKRGGKVRLMPVAYSDWEHILTGLQGKVDAKITKLKRGESKQAAQEFYYPVLQDLRAIRDAFRNHVMHTRREYTRHEADAILDRVVRLMTALASRVSGA